MSNHKAERACKLRQYEITDKDLPLSCPMPTMQLWDAHPRVFLPIETTGHAVCPYCAAMYFLKDFQKTSG